MVIKPKVVKAFVKQQFPFDGPDLPYSSDFRVMFIAASSIVGPPFSPGGEQKRYCALFGGTIIKNDATVFRAKDAPAPTACSPSGAFLDDEAGL